MSGHRIILRAAVQGVYDLQQLRIASGLRLCANFRSKLKLNTPPPTLEQFGAESREVAAYVISKTSPLPPPSDELADTESGDPFASRERDAANEANREHTKAAADALNKASPAVPLDQAVAAIASEAENLEEATKLLDQLRMEYRRLTDGIASPRGRAKKKEFKGMDLISTETEKVLCDMYFGLEREEAFQFKTLTLLLEPIPIYNTWLEKQQGVGPAMASVIIAYLDPHKARHVSSFWKYSGLDIGPDGAGRSRRQEHLIEREYQDKNGDTKTRMSVTYEPFLKTKLMGVLAGCFLRGSAQPWRQIYNDYKHRLETDPSRKKVTVTEWKKLYKKHGPDHVKDLWTPGRVNNASKRYMVKMFLQELWLKWRPLENLEVTEPYPVAKQGQAPHKAA